MPPDAKLRQRRRWPWILLAAGLALVALVVSWWQLQGVDFLYGQIRPDDARLLAGLEIPDPPSAENLVTDLRFLGEEMPRRHVAFAQAFDPAAWRARLARLEEEAARLSPAQRQMALLEIFASGGVGAGHTLVVPVQRALDWRTYGLAFWDFDDGLHVVDADAVNEDLVGARVLKVGGVDAQRALERLAPYASADNRWTRRLRTPMLLAFAEPLVAVGLAEPDGRLVLTVDSGSGPYEAEVEPFRLATLRGFGWGRKSQEPHPGAWSPADLRPRRPYYRIEEPEDGIVVLHIDEVRNAGEGESLGDFVERAVGEAGRRPAESPLRRFVVDLRSNGGGNNRLGRAVVAAIEGDPVIDRRGVLYVLVGRRTFSAAGNLAAALERRTRATFAGEPTGATPVHYGDSVPVLLPGTKVIGRLATRLWRDDLPGVGRSAIEPALPVPLTAADHFAGRDPAITAVLGHEPGSRQGGEEALPSAVVGPWLVSPFHRVVIEAAAEGDDTTGDRPPRLLITTGEPFVTTDLHPLGGGRWGTDITGVELDVTNGDRPLLHWKGVELALRPAPAEHLLPLEQLRDSRDGPVEPIIAAYRRAADELAPDSDHELAINGAGYRLLDEERFDDAVALFRLATDLFPASANTWDSLGDGLRRQGDPEAAAEAYRHALRINPTLDHPRRQLEAIGRSTP